MQSVSNARWSPLVSGIKYVGLQVTIGTAITDAKQLFVGYGRENAGSCVLMITSLAILAKNQLARTHLLHREVVCETLYYLSI